MAQERSGQREPAAGATGDPGREEDPGHAAASAVPEGHAAPSGAPASAPVDASARLSGKAAGAEVLAQARALAGDGHHADALELLGRSLTLSGPDGDWRHRVRREMAPCLVKLARYGEAIAMLRALSAEDPGDAGILVLLGESLQALGRISDAVDVWYQAARLSRNDPDMVLRLTGLLVRAGRPAEAVPLFSGVTRHIGSNPDALLDQGYALMEAGRLDDALGVLAHAEALRPDNPDIHVTLARIHLLKRNEAEVAERLQKALSLAPDHAVAAGMWGDLLVRRNRCGEAAAAYRVALARTPGDVSLLTRLASALWRVRNLPEAEATLQRAIGAGGNTVDIHFGLGLVLERQGRYHDALTSFRQACRLSPSASGPTFGLARVLSRLERHDEAIRTFRTGMTLAPDNVQGEIDLARTLRSSHRLPEALELLCGIRERCPQRAEVSRLIGMVCSDMGRFEEAGEAFCDALAHAPRDARTLARLAMTLGERGYFSEAAGYYGEALQLGPGNLDLRASHVRALQHLCDWDGAGPEIDIIERRLRERDDRNRNVFPCRLLAITGDATLLRQNAASFSAACLGVPPPPPPIRRLAPHEPLRVGYLLPGCPDPVVAADLPGILEHHDPGQVSPVVYATCAGHGTPLWRRLTRGDWGFADLSDVSDGVADSRIRSDRIDLLVSLGGFLPRARLRITARRPAPVMAHWLGYPGGGVPFADFLIADPVSVPPGAERLYDERICRLPLVSLPLDVARYREIAQSVRVSRAGVRLPREAVVLACFSEMPRLSRQVFGIWMRILHEIPRAVLWLTPESDAAGERLREFAVNADIDPTRIVLSPVLPREKHVPRVRLADLGLDTSPWGAQSGAVDFLASGVPMVSLAGESLASRRSASLLQALGMGRLVTGSLAQYEATILRLLRQPGELAAIRHQLADALDQNPPGSHAAMAADLGEAFHRMHRTLLEERHDGGL